MIYLKYLLIALLVLVVSLSAVPALAAPIESVQVTATPTLVSVSLSHADLDFGAVALDQESEHATAVVVTNNGSVVADIEMKGSDAECSDPSANTWTLSAVENGVNQFMLKISKDSNWTAGVINLSTGYAALQAALGVSVGQSFQTKLKMPTATSVYGEHAARIYVRATEH